MNYYQILEIERNATPDDIEKAYKKLALKYHPDKNPSDRERATEEFKQISKAREILSDPEKKKQYDEMLCSDSMTPYKCLLYAILVSNDVNYVRELLKDHSIDVNDVYNGSTFFDHAIKFNCCEIVECFLSNGARINNDSVRLAIESDAANAAKVLDLLLRKYDTSNINTQDANGNTILHYIFSNERRLSLLSLNDTAKLIIFFVQKGADYNVKNNQCITPLDMCIDLSDKQYHQKDVVESYYSILDIFIKKGIIGLKYKNDTPISHKIIELNIYPHIKNKAEINLMEKDSDGKDVLSYIIKDCVEIATIKSLIEDKNILNSSRWVLLYHVISAYLNKIQKIDYNPQLEEISAHFNTMLETLVTTEASLDITDSSGSTLLHSVVLAYCGRVEKANCYDPQLKEINACFIHMLETLVKAGANLNVADSSGQTLLHHIVLACCDGSEQTDYIHKLKKVKACFIPMLETLVKAGAKLNVANSSGSTLLHRVVLAYCGRVEKANCYDPQLKEINACFIHMLETLVKAGANLNVADSSGQTLLHHIVLACCDGSEQTDYIHKLKKVKACFIPMLETLVKAGAKLNVANSSGSTLLHRVVLAYCDEIEKTGYDYELEEVKACFIPMLEILVKAGASLDITDSSGSTLLHHIVLAYCDGIEKTGYDHELEEVKACFIPMLEILVKAGASLDITDSSRSTLLHRVVLAYCGRVEKANCYDPQLKEINACFIHMLETLVKAGANLNVADSSGQTLLHHIVLACCDGSEQTDYIHKLKKVKACFIPMLETLVKAGAKLNVANSSGSTLLHRVVLAYCDEIEKTGYDYELEEVKACFIPMLEILVKAGASLDITDSSGSTLLHHIVLAYCDGIEKTGYDHELEEVKACFIPMLEILVKAGANIETKDKHGKCPVDLLKERCKSMKESRYCSAKQKTENLDKAKNLLEVKSEIEVLPENSLAESIGLTFVDNLNIEAEIEAEKENSSIKEKGKEKQHKPKNTQYSKSVTYFTIATALSALLITAAFLTQAYIILAALIIPTIIGLYGWSLYKEENKPDSKLQENIEVENISTLEREAGGEAC